LKHVHECPSCTEDWDCEDEECYNIVDDTYILEKTCKGCREDDGI